MDIQWAEPPAHAIKAGQKPGKYVAFATALREHKDRWAKLPSEDGRTAKGAAGTAQNIRRGVVKGFAKGEYETAVDGSEVYVRFIGSKDAEEKPGLPLPDPDGHQVRGNGQGAEIRRWALANGYDVPERGRLPRHIIDAFFEQNPDEAEEDSE